MTVKRRLTTREVDVLPEVAASTLQQSGAAKRGKKADQYTRGTESAAEVRSPTALRDGSDLGARGRPVDAAEAVELGALAGGWARVGAKLISAEDIENALRTGDFSKLAIQPDPALLRVYRSLAKALSAHGVNGPSGNGMGLGPVGDDPWNPSEFMRAIGEWHSPNADLGQNGDPKIGAAVLGDDRAMREIASALESLAPGLSRQLLPGAIFDAIGPYSRSGREGDTGWLGPVGGHGLGQDLHGNFIRGRDVVRTVDLDVNGKPVTFDLVEKYDAETAQKMTDNDASWMIRGGVKTADKKGHTFNFNVKKGQLVMLQVGSESLKDTFQIELIRDGKVLKRSAAHQLLNSIRFQAESDGKLQVRVTRMNVPPVKPEWSDLVVQSITAPTVIGFGLLKPWLELSGMKFKRHPEGSVYRLSSTSSNVATEAHAIAAKEFAAKSGA